MDYEKEIAKMKNKKEIAKILGWDSIEGYLKCQKKQHELFGQITAECGVGNIIDAMEDRIKKDIRKRKNNLELYGDLQQSRLLIGLIIAHKYLINTMNLFLDFDLLETTFSLIEVEEPDIFTRKELTPLIIPPDIGIEDNRIILC